MYTDGRSSSQQRRPLISPICWLFCNSPPILIETLTTIQNVVTLCVCIAMYSLSLKNLHFLFWRAVFLYNIIFNDVVRSPSVVIVACISTIKDTGQTECKLWIGQTMATEWRKTSFHVHHEIRWSLNVTLRICHFNTIFLRATLLGIHFYISVHVSENAIGELYLNNVPKLTVGTENNTQYYDQQALKIRTPQCASLKQLQRRLLHHKTIILQQKCTYKIYFLTVLSKI